MMQKLFKIFVVVMVVLGFSISANAKGFKKFEPIQTPQPVNDSSKVEVLSIFAYSCGHCYTFHTQHLDHWEKPNGVDFIGVPALFNPANEHLVRSYHAAVILGIVDEFHPAVFTTSRNNRKAVKDKNALAKFATAYGVTEKEFLDAYDSFAVEVKMSQSKQMLKNYRIHSVPTVIVNGKYKVSASITGSHKKVIESMDELIATEKVALGIVDEKVEKVADKNSDKMIAKIQKIDVKIEEKKAKSEKK